MIPFNFEAATAGKPIVQRNGMEAVIVGELNGDLIVDMLVLEDDGYGILDKVEIRTIIGADGRCNPALGETDCDLFMVS